MSNTILSSKVNSLPIDCQATPGVTPWVEYGRGTVGVADKVTPTGSTLKLNASAVVDSSPVVAGSSPSSPGAYVQQWICTREVSSAIASNPCTNLQGTRVIGFGRIKSLLQPKHKYFENKYAEIVHWTRYLDTDNHIDMVYPKVKTYHRENPYRKYQLNQQSSARAAKKMFKLIRVAKIKGARITDLTLTMPAAVSEYLASQGKRGLQQAWSMESRFWQLMKDSNLIGEGFARRGNLHIWKTENPLLPHYHFHELIPNIEQVGMADNVIDMPKYTCSKCGKTLWARSEGGYYCATCNGIKGKPVFSIRKWNRNRKYTFVPFNEEQLLLVKALWLQVVINFARQKVITGAWTGKGKGKVEYQNRLMNFQRRYGVKGMCRLISFMSRSGKGLIDVYLAFDKLNTDTGRAKFVHKLAYNGRHPVVDYAVYSNKNPDCDFPSELVDKYNNHARLYGWWRDIDKILKDYPLSEEEEREKLSPYTAKPMEYLGRYDNSELLDCQGGRLVAVDIIRGSPIERYITDEEKGWLELIKYKQFGTF